MQNARDFTAKTNFQFFFDGLFLGENLLVYTLIIVPLIACLFFFGIKEKDWDQKKLYKTLSSVLGYAVVGGAVLAIVVMNTFNFPYTAENKYDFNAVYYAMTQVYAGVPMLVDGFTSTYGLYPHFLNPVFHLIGLNVLKFSMVLSLLTGLAFTLNFYLLKQYVKSNVILFLGFATILFFPYLDFKLLTSFDCSFAFFPIRYIIPSTLTFLASIYFLRRSQVVYWAVFALMAFFILWNPEFGLVCYISWVAVNIYNDFYTTSNTINLKKILFHLLAAVGVLIVVFFAFKFIILIIYGRSPDLSLLFSAMGAFSRIGFGLLPMSLVHPWNTEALIFMMGITYCIVKWYKKQITPKASMVFLICVIGLGFFIYFQGRSHNWQFATSSIICLMLLTILGDELWAITRRQNILAINALFVLFLFIISISFVEIVFGAKKINELMYQEDDKIADEKQEEQINSNTAFILKNSSESEKMLVITALPNQSLYFDGNKRKAAFNPGLGDMLVNDDLNRMVNTIRDSSFDIFAEPNYCQYFFFNRPLAAMAATYEVKNVNLSMVYLKKRKEKVLSSIFFAHDDTLFHRKYLDDRVGFDERINDATGIDKIEPNQEFSIEALFFSDPQILQFATVIGNMNDSEGFVISKVVNTNNYLFGINGKGVGVPVPDKKWIYCVMNVYPDHYDIYENDSLMGTHPIDHPMRKSTEKLYIGNLVFLRYFVGPICEVAITKKPIDKEQIQKTWNEIKSATLQPAAQ